MKKSYEKKIPTYNVMKFSLIVKDDINMFFSIKGLNKIVKNAILQVNSINGIKKNPKRLEIACQKKQAYKTMAW